MNQAALETFARGYITGFFDVVSTMLSKPAPNAVASVEPCGASELAGYLEKFNALVRAQIESGGAVAVLLSGSDANAIVARALGEDTAADVSISGRDPAGLREVFGPCLSGGANFFNQQYGNVLVLKGAEALACGPGISAGLLQLVGAESSAATFSFSLGDGHDGTGVLLFSNVLSSVVPQDSPAQGGSTVAGSMSQDEVSAMLNGLGSDAEAEPTAPAPAPPAREDFGSDPRNLDMVLDIRLTASARLGRVDMQIADILSLGPGSIIEVGHLVDEPVELLVNDKLIARGDVVVVDEKFGLRITEIVSPRERIESLR
jgi:flagellar motor switch protein FliN/FliY